MGNRVGDVLLEIIGEALRSMISKIEDVLKYLSNKISLWLDKARRFFDNFSEAFKEAVVKSKQAINDEIAKVPDLLGKLKDLGKFDSLIQLKNNVAPILLKLMLILSLVGDNTKIFHVLMKELKKKTKNKCVVSVESGCCVVEAFVDSGCFGAKVLLNLFLLLDMAKNHIV